MTLRMRAAAAVIAAGASIASIGGMAPAAASPGDEALFGFWQTKEDATIEIRYCGTTICGVIVDLKIPPGKTRADMVDAKNPAKARRGTSLYGLRILRKLRPAGRNRWEGRVYSPRLGRRADATVSLIDGGDRLKIKGCVDAVIEICRDETWQRVP